MILWSLLSVNESHMDLVLSLFPGIDLLGRGFEAEEYCIVRGPDLLWGGDIRSFHPPSERFAGVIGGSPCQDFSKKRRCPPTGYGLEMLHEYTRVVTEAAPDWFLLENVPTVPDIAIPGYTVQRFDLNARECGSSQSRLRHFQFGSRYELVIIPERKKTVEDPEPICLASEGKTIHRRDFSDFCELQGLPRDFDLPGFSLAAKYAAVGNGVPVNMARVIARSIRVAIKKGNANLCICGCGRLVYGRQVSALPACRKRLERRRKRDASMHVDTGSVTS
jgi:DNA (cytosine-5)-methyltransferase 1